MGLRKRRLVREGDNRGKGMRKKKKGGEHTCTLEVMILASAVHLISFFASPSVRGSWS